jgi:hypothetical protein
MEAAVMRAVEPRASRVSMMAGHMLGGGEGLGKREREEQGDEPA